jgi:hypothetical protein
MRANLSAPAAGPETAHVISSNRATPGQILAAAERELTLALPRLIACRNRLYRETGTYPDDLGAAIFRLDFLLRDIMAGLVSPADVKAESAKRGRGSVQ